MKMNAKKFMPLLALASITLAGCVCAPSEEGRPERKIAVQTYSYRLFTLEDALKNAKSAGVDFVEIYPGQKISSSMPNAKFGKDLTAQEREAVKKMLAQNGLTVVSMGVVGGNPKEDFIKQTCEFAKDMGIKRILIECPVSTFPLWKKYAQANGITICIHHHSTFSPNLFADPDVMKSLADEYGFKVCADIGHWEASGIDPVQALKKLKGNIGELHIKDKRVPDGNKKSVCVPFGEGTVDLKGVLKELDAQKFDGFFVIEYEAEWENNTPSIKKSVEFLRKN